MTRKEDAVAELSRVASTESGMLAIFAPEEFAGVRDQVSWAAELGSAEKIRERIVAGGLVPVNIGGDGAWQVVLRADGTGLTEREDRYLMLSSEPYLLVCHGIAHIGGIEEVCAEPQDTGLPVRPGRYSVVVHLIEWEAEPGSRDADGQPAADALPDFVVLLEWDAPLVSDLATSGPFAPVYRQELMTFDAAQRVSPNC
ncbi:hypothetical protein N8J89_21110 [Crossiella sp. CA-258035]|uniref:hypothetical protein n=1 Tax=Crossiella sp. CA-258035 TaxID=2981138 RepID=UPI0024BBED21|nr:hypothetical protein [Crossiella sp. CA-258035]WHT15646.1 hypothetical protein N8J89_21110 [Crossiella sp. CA-258035]